MVGLLKPRLAQKSNMTLQCRLVFDWHSLLVNLQRELRIEPHDFGRLRPRLGAFAQLTVDRCQGQMGPMMLG